jgi:hypothetical protein
VAGQFAAGLLHQLLKGDSVFREAALQSPCAQAWLSRYILHRGALSGEQTVSECL